MSDDPNNTPEVVAFFENGMDIKTALELPREVVTTVAALDDSRFLSVWRALCDYLTLGTFTLPKDAYARTIAGNMISHARMQAEKHRARRRVKQITAQIGWAKKHGLDPTDLEKELALAKKPHFYAQKPPAMLMQSNCNAPAMPNSNPNSNPNCISMRDTPPAPPRGDDVGAALISPSRKSRRPSWKDVAEAAYKLGLPDEFAKQFFDDMERAEWAYVNRAGNTVCVSVANLAGTMDGRWRAAQRRADGDAQGTDGGDGETPEVRAALELARKAAAV